MFPRKEKAALSSAQYTISHSKAGATEAGATEADKGGRLGMVFL